MGRTVEKKEDVMEEKEVAAGTKREEKVTTALPRKKSAVKEPEEGAIVDSGVRGTRCPKISEDGSSRCPERFDCR